MKVEPQILEALRIAIRNEWSATSQYQAHADYLKRQGYVKLAAYELETSNEEREHADLLLSRLALLDNMPVPENAKLDCKFGSDVPSILSYDLDGEVTGHTHYVNTIKLCERMNDYVTRDVIVEILGDEERHISNIEARQSQIEAMGLDNFLASMI